MSDSIFSPIVRQQDYKIKEEIVGLYTSMVLHPFFFLLLWLASSEKQKH